MNQAVETCDGNMKLNQLITSHRGLMSPPGLPLVLKYLRCKACIQVSDLYWKF